MKILKRGTLPSEEVFRGICSNCKSEFECKRHEGIYKEDFREGGGWLEVTCPVCLKRANAYKSKGGDLVPLDQRKYQWLPEHSYYSTQADSTIINDR